MPGRPVLAHAADAVEADGLLFVAGLLPVDPDGALVGPGSASEQARFVLEELARVLDAAGRSAADLVKANVYVTAREAVGPVERAWHEVLGVGGVAVTTVVVPALAIAGAEVEVDAVAGRA